MLPVDLLTGDSNKLRAQLVDALKEINHLAECCEAYEKRITGLEKDLLGTEEPWKTKLKEEKTKAENLTVRQVLKNTILGMPVIIEYDYPECTEELIRVPYISYNGKCTIPECYMDLVVKLISIHEDETVCGEQLTYMLLTVSYN